MRRIKTLGAAAMVLTALCSLFAGSASAAAVTEDVKWFTGAGGAVELAAAENVSASQVGPASFHTNGYEITWTGTECVGCKIEIVGGTAVGSGRLKFNGVTVTEPAGCSAPAAITTNALSLQADWMGGATNYWKFTPTAGAATAFATIEITGCPQEAVLVPKGIVFFQTANATKVQAVEQEMTTSEAINTAASGAAKALHVGANAGELTLTLKFKMNRVPAEAFGTH